MVIAFIDAYRPRFVVEPICQVLRQQGVGIAPSTYYAAKTRPPSGRSLADLTLVAEVSRVHGSRDIGGGLYGARKVWRHLQREGQPVARCTIERPMRANGMRGVVRGARVRATIADD